MYEFTLGLHNILRWVIVVIALFTIIRAFIGWFGKKDWQDLDDKLGMYYTIGLDIQLVLGLILYFVLSPITASNFSNFAGAMGESDIRFLLIEHFLLMIIAIVVAHIGRSRIKKAEGSLSKYKGAAIFYTISFLLILTAIPWWADRLLPFIG